MAREATGQSPKFKVQSFSVAQTAQLQARLAVSRGTVYGLRVPQGKVLLLQNKWVIFDGF
ncbi:MAG: hypothetical protein FJ403_19315 [Verrucomicrobia bacterium]|nr:hypothetical protein [Verrucomicrobiota bacterium]